MATIPLNTHPWTVPAYVLVKAPSPNMHDLTLALDKVPAETLDEMCNDFRREVFKRAGRVDPRLVVTR